ncbi:hypothetical protein GGH12_004727 [Coemansia sp. RSA 1822]|nr:hypothetical protein LPJ76_004596 [Coemansia sp. RSA 638]KAJ2541617.1 hypothetical protein GGF49_003533 [Coemansia sp. RSA 1853]KAJ2560550.1 hypothetical protein GGH12_004727 [Coemansia sp. RSA 1822]
MHEKNGRRHTIKNTIRRSLRRETATSEADDETSERHERQHLNPHNLFRHGTETERGLVELLQPGCRETPGEKQESRGSAWHMLRRIYPVMRLPWGRSDDDTASDGAMPHTHRRRDADHVYRDGVLLAQQLGTSALNRSEIQRILAQARGDADAARRQVQLLLRTRDGIVYDVDNRVRQRGAENADSTCYIDSVLAALFASHTACDGLLYMRDLGSDAANGLQAMCRLLANYLRAGELISAELMRELRTQLVRCGWEGAQGQHDAGELYMFLAETLRMPYLPLEVRMEHGADTDTDDSRIVTQRVIELALPDGAAPVPLHALLAQHFFDNRIEHVERELRGGVEPVKVRTNAWAMLAMHPFYTPQSEIGDSAAEYPLAAPLVVPLLLKRYRADAAGVHRIARRVNVPTELDVTDIISSGQPLSDNKGAAHGLFSVEPTDAVQRPLDTANRAELPPYSAPTRYRLVLRAAVCHKGASANSGHYVAYATRGAQLWPRNQAAGMRRHSWPAESVPACVDVESLQMDDVETSEFQRFDDMDSATEFQRFDDMDVAHGRVQCFTGRACAQSLDEIATDGYLLFYTLQSMGPGTSADCPCVCAPSRRRASDNDKGQAL